ncbi:hypothetical protein [uncultured Pseudodesulfovibrio sp.]|uniref:hypothetical protein n=1 Tax=uncultured Pseudodesulfovibrio sp. TaxID=2035858 RepID=UPI0029C99413|nr:hypothetical protein [uncultured Pseudodesulfovibrio sp.]
MADFENLISVENRVIGNSDKMKMTRVTTYDAAVVRSAAQYEKEFGDNGFSDKRNHRVIGEMPLIEFLDMQAEAQKSGDTLSGKDLKKWLAEHPEFMTVTRINHANANAAGTGPLIIMK